MKVFVPVQADLLRERRDACLKYPLPVRSPERLIGHAGFYMRARDSFSGRDESQDFTSPP